MLIKLEKKGICRGQKQVRRNKTTHCQNFRTLSRGGRHLKLLY